MRALELVPKMERVTRVGNYNKLIWYINELSHCRYFDSTYLYTLCLIVNLFDTFILLKLQNVLRKVAQTKGRVPVASASAVPVSICIIVNAQNFIKYEMIYVI